VKRRLVFLPGAEADLVAAAEFYDRKRPGLGEELVTALDRAVATIEDSPSAQPLFRPDRPLRKYTLARFPCILVFREEPEQITAVAVVHGRRRPQLLSGVRPTEQ
jgi:plasmid stabilization system protein ParE